VKQILEPCPACGGDNPWITLTRETPYSYVWAEITCQHCWLKVESEYETAIETWNIASKKKKEKNK
jgi:hypothetical protein